MFAWYQVLVVAMLALAVGTGLGFWSAQRVYEKDTQELVKSVERIQAKDVELQAMAQKAVDYQNQDMFYDHFTGKTFRFHPDASEETRMMARRNGLVGR